jgi:hypothetical protein
MFGLLGWWSAQISNLTQATLMCFLLGRLLTRMCKINYVGTAAWSSDPNFQSDTELRYVFCFLLSSSSETSYSSYMTGTYVQ